MNQGTEDQKFIKTMRIAVVNGKILFPNIGGAAKSMLAQSIELEKMGVEVKIVSGDSIDYINGFQNINFLKLRQIGFDRLKDISFIKVFENWKQAISLFIYIIKNSFLLNLRKSEFDIINNQGYWILRQDVLTMLFCIKKYANLTTPRSCTERIINCIDLRFNLLLLVENIYLKFKLYKKIVVNSEYTKRNICEIYKIPHQDVHVIPDGYDAVFSKYDLNNKDYLKSLSGFKNKTTIMWAGYNPARKNLELFLEYIELNPDVIGLVVGVDLNKASKYGKIGENAKKSVEMFTWENSARMYLDLYNSILKK